MLVVVSFWQFCSLFSVHQREKRESNYSIPFLRRKTLIYIQNKPLQSWSRIFLIIIARFYAVSPNLLGTQQMTKSDEVRYS
jgi:hypothetical protein